MHTNVQLLVQIPEIFADPCSSSMENKFHLSRRRCHLCWECLQSYPTYSRFLKPISISPSFCKILSLTQTTPPILIGRVHSHDFRSHCIVNNDLTPSSQFTHHLTLRKDIMIKPKLLSLNRHDSDNEKIIHN